MTSLKTRLVAYYSLVVTATLGGGLFVGFKLLEHQLISGSDFLLEKEFVETKAKLEPLAPPYTEQAIHDAVNPHALLDAALFYFQIHDREGNVLYRSPNLKHRFLPDLTKRELATKATMSPGDWETLRVFEGHHNGLHIQLATSLRYLDRINAQFAWGMAVGLPLVLLVSVGVGILLSQVTLRPLRAIQDAAQRINADNMSERIPQFTGRDELARLTTLLNDMFDRLENAFVQIKQVTADTSHELRTPLSIIQLRVESALKHEGLPDDVRADLEDVRVELDNILRLMDQLMTLAKAESRVLPLECLRQSTRPFIRHFQEDAVVLAEHGNRNFEVVANEDLQVAFDESWIRQVLFNLLSNALKHAPERSTIRLSSVGRDGHWCLTLRDEGPGVPADQVNQIFRRFYQANRHGDQGGGCGLGLAVCKSIVELHHGRLACQNEEGDGGKGFAIYFEIPLADAAR